jgi:hypothetical protein
VEAGLERVCARRRVSPIGQPARSRSGQEGFNDLFAQIVHEAPQDSRHGRGGERAVDGDREAVAHSRPVRRLVEAEEPEGKPRRLLTAEDLEDDEA